MRDLGAVPGEAKAMEGGKEERKGGRKEILPFSWTISNS